MTHLNGCPSEVFWTACNTVLYTLNATVPAKTNNDKYAATLMTEKNEMANKMTNPVPNTAPDFFTSRQ